MLPDNGMSRRATLVFMLGLAASIAAIGVLGQLIGVNDGVMLLLWLAAGVVYYQLLRFPRAIVAAVQWAGRAPELGKIGPEESPTSET